MTCVGASEEEEEGGRDCTMADVDRSNFLWWSFSIENCKSITLNNHTLGDRGAAALSRALRGNKGLLSLKLERCGIGERGATELANVLPETRLEKLDLDANKLGSAGARAIAGAIPGSSLRELDLEENSILDAGASALAEALRTAPFTLVKLDLETNGIGDDGAADLARALPRNRGMKELDLHGNAFGARGFRALARAAQRNRKLEKLSLPSANMLLPLRQRRHQSVLIRLTEKLVAANEDGASPRKKKSVLKRAIRHEKAQRRSAKAKGRKG